MKVLAVDPGRVTGYAYGAFSEGHLYFAPYQQLDDVEEFWDRIDRYKPSHLVVEDFQFRKGAARGGLDLFPMALIGVAQLYSIKRNIGLTMQQPAQGKGYYTDVMLKRLGLYLRGTEHGRDATRHLLQWTTFGPGYKYVGKENKWAHLIGVEAFIG